MSLPVLLLVVSGLLAVVSLVQRLAARLVLPASILFAVMGVLIGTAATLVLRSHLGGSLGELAQVFVNIPVTSETFIYIFVPALLFQSSLTIDVRRVIEDAMPIFLLAVVAVLVATLAIGLALWPVAGLPLVPCLLLASIVATTDSVAVIAIFREVGAPARLCRLVEGESLLNDAAAIVTFAVLLEIVIVGHSAGFSAASIAFVWTFLGGLAVGYLGARLVVGILPWLQDLRLAQVTLTLALPYIVFIVSERALGVSGVIAAVVAGLVMSALAQQRIAPNDWKFLLSIWEQLAYWASSLIFVLAALLVPRLLLDVGWNDALMLVIQIVAALAARALILWGFFPAMAALGLGERVSNRFNIVILWGGLRGAVTLALALAITENKAVSYEIQRFVAVQATGFVLFSLLVPGLTLRPLIRWLGLDRLSPLDQVIRSQVLALARRRVADAVRAIGEQYRLTPALVSEVATSFGPAKTRDADPVPPNVVVAAADTDEGDEEQLRIGLVAMTQREREIVLAHFDGRTVSGRMVEELLTEIGLLLERARTRGESGYVRTSHEIVGFSRWFRFAHLLHRRLHLDGPLVDRLADRFERLLVSRIVIESLEPHIADTLEPLVGNRIAARLRTLLAARQEMIAAALDALRSQYPEYATLLEQRFLWRVALGREDLEYRTLFDERTIGPELFSALQREVQTARTGVDLRPRLDLGLETRALVARVPMFAALTGKQLDAVSRLLRPQFAVPGERLIAAGDPGNAMYFISSGAVDVSRNDRLIQLSRGDFFGEMALVLNQRRQANVTAVGYCQLLVLQRHDFRALLKSSPAIRERIDLAVDARVKMNQQD